MQRYLLLAITIPQLYIVRVQHFLFFLIRALQNYDNINSILTIFHIVGTTPTLCNNPYVLAAERSLAIRPRYSTTQPLFNDIRQRCASFTTFHCINICLMSTARVSDHKGN